MGTNKTGSLIQICAIDKASGDKSSAKLPCFSLFQVFTGTLRKLIQGESTASFVRSGRATDRVLHQGSTKKNAQENNNRWLGCWYASPRAPASPAGQLELPAKPERTAPFISGHWQARSLDSVPTLSRLVSTQSRNVRFLAR